MPTDPVLNDSPWGYWRLDWGSGDSSGNGRDLTVSSGDIGEQQFGYYPPFEGLPGTRGGVVWATGFTPGADWTFRAVVQRNGTIYLLSDGATRLDVASAHLSVYPSGAGTSVWGWTPYNIPIIIYLVSSGGTINYWYADYYGWDGIGPVTSGSFSASLSGPLFIGPSGGPSLSMYASVALFDYALSPWRIAVQMSGVEPALAGEAANLTAEMLDDTPVGLWALPAGEGDEITDETGLAGDATLDAGGGFTAAQQTPGGFLFADSTFELPETLDTSTLTVEFVYRANDDDGASVTLTSGDFEATASAVAGTTYYSVSAAGDYVSWGTTTDTRDHLVSVTWDASGDLTLYVDGIARASTASTTSITPDATIAVQSSADSQSVGTIAVYDAVLDPSRIAAHGATLLPSLMRRIVVDDFDRADGVLGSTSFLGKPWTAVNGSPVIASNTAEGGGAFALGIPGARGVVAEVNRGATTTSLAFVGVGWYNEDLADGRLHGVMVDWAAGQIAPAYWGPTYGWSSYGPAYPASFGTTVEVRIQLDGPIDNDPMTGYGPSSLWVDGLLIAAGVPLPINDGNDWAGFYTTAYLGGGTASISWLDALEAPHDLGGSAQPEQVGGLEFRFWPFDGVLLGSSTQGPQVGGLAPPGDPIRDSRPVFLGASPTVPQRGGIRTIWTNGTVPAPDPNTPPVWAGVGSPPADLAVGGFPLRTEASCRPTMNGAGTGSFTVVPPGPALGDVIVYSSGGSAVFSGYADQITTVERDQAEESGQLVSVTTPCLLSIDWSETVVWPDFGAFEPIRLGAPPQDDREFGWPMNGLVDADNEAALVPSVGNDPARWGTPNEVLPIPDNWPDSTARWMWDITPDWTAQPQGWVYFRVPFGTWPGRYAVFLNAWDYAKCWIDGAMVAEVTTPGQTVRFDVDFDWDFHLVAIAAYNEGGPAGVMFSVMKHSTDGSGLLAAANGSGLDAPAMNSRGGWKCLPYPEKSLRAPIGKVIRRLVREAAARGAPAGEWSCAFTDEADSAGRSWDQDVLIVQRTGQTMWDVLNQAAESLVDFRPSPAGKTLYLYKKDQGAGAVGQPWAPTVHAEALATEVSGR